MLIDMRSATITEKGQISIPRLIRKIKGFEKGARIAVVAYDDRIELRPLKTIEKKLRISAASEKALAKDWNSKEDETAWKDL